MKYKTSKYNKLLHVGIGTFAGSAGVEDDDEAAVIIYLMTFLVFSFSFHFIMDISQFYQHQKYE